MRLYLSLFICIVSMFVSREASAIEVTLIAEYRNQSLKFIESRSLKIPDFCAGYYVEWSNEKEFISRQPLAEGSKYQVTANVVRTQNSRFPEEGWGERSGKCFLTYYLEVISATPWK